MGKKFTCVMGYDTGDTEFVVRITYTCIPAQPAQGPSYASGGEPAEPAELEILDITYDNGKPIQKELYQRVMDDDYVHDYLGDECDWGVPYRDPDDARDAMRDRG